MLLHLTECFLREHSRFDVSAQQFSVSSDEVLGIASANNTTPNARGGRIEVIRGRQAGPGDMNPRCYKPSSGRLAWHQAAPLKRRGQVGIAEPGAVAAPDRSTLFRTPPGITATARGVRVMVFPHGRRYRSAAARMGPATRRCF